MVTGKIDLGDLQLKTNWGKAHIKADAINTISASQFGSFYSDSSGGGWRYTRGKVSPNQGSAIRGSGQRILNGR